MYHPIRPGHAGAPSARQSSWLARSCLSVSGSCDEQCLNGAPVEYVLLTLTPKEAGLREATLSFDVGQGTQDLGFRGELPVLFRCIRAGTK